MNLATFRRFCAQQGLVPMRRIDAEKGTILLAEGGGFFEGKPMARTTWCIAKNEGDLQFAQDIWWDPKTLPSTLARLAQAEQDARMWLDAAAPHFQQKLVTV